MAEQGIIIIRGICDTEYTGNIQVILANISKTAYIIKKDDRIAQGIMHSTTQIKFFIQVSTRENLSKISKWQQNGFRLIGTFANNIFNIISI